MFLPNSSLYGDVFFLSKPYNCKLLVLKSIAFKNLIKRGTCLWLSVHHVPKYIVIV